MTGLFKNLPPVQKFRAIIQRKKAAAKDKDRSRAIPGSRSTLRLDNPNPLPPWGLPVEIQILIFAHCGTYDFLALKLVCKAFYDILTAQEHEIVRRYLRRHRHGTLPSPIDSDRTYTRNPEDDVVLLSDLFPPSKSARGGHLYTFRYLSGLRHKQNICSRLCYFLADRVVDRFVSTEPVLQRSSFPTRRADRTVLMHRGRAGVWFHLAPLMYYILYFLHAYNSARREQTNRLLRDYEAGTLNVPVPLEKRRQMNRDLQTEILRQPPFTNTAALVATHHCMHLLVSYIRFTLVSMAPGVEPDDSWISSLLTVAPFVRIVEFLSAEIGDGGNQRLQRKDFMYNFYQDTKNYEKDQMNAVIFGKTTEQNLHSSVSDVWFDVAKAELVSRDAIPHDAEQAWHWNGIPILFGCANCHPVSGWRA